MDFLAELKTTGSKKKGLDNIYSVRFETDDPKVLKLGEYPADTYFVVKVEKNE